MNRWMPTTGLPTMVGTNPRNHGDRWRRVSLWATLSRDAKFGPLVCSPGSRKPILPAQPDVTLVRFDIGRTRAATRRPMSPPHSTTSNRRLIDMA